MGRSTLRLIPTSALVGCCDKTLGEGAKYDGLMGRRFLRLPHDFNVGVGTRHLGQQQSVMMTACISRA